MFLWLMRGWCWASENSLAWLFGFLTAYLFLPTFSNPLQLLRLRLSQNPCYNQALLKFTNRVCLPLAIQDDTFASPRAISTKDSITKLEKS
ncbi:hypothetical protein BJY01DRAFT_214514 [Aspergillus pseudoustus]|uniref:Secreted protein n=1 Tax=Aspergillus pseudoustus TaxID=1810923 RepID=A0ABR4JYD2_9EURO